jgi:GNAT superfamily N-acetyltransferase
MTKRKPVYFALHPENPGHAMAYWGDRYEPIAEVKWQTKGLPGYGEGWAPSPEEQGHVDWVWSHPHARKKGITRNLLQWVKDNHEPSLHGSNSMTPQGKALSEALGEHVDDSQWNRLQPVRGYDRPINDAPYRMVDEGRDEWDANGRPDGYV